MSVSRVNGSGELRAVEIKPSATVGNPAELVSLGQRSTTGRLTYGRQGSPTIYGDDGSLYRLILNAEMSRRFTKTVIHDGLVDQRKGQVVGEAFRDARGDVLLKVTQLVISNSAT